MKGLLYKEGINVAAFASLSTSYRYADRYRAQSSLSALRPARNARSLFKCQHTRYFGSVGRFSQRCCDSQAPKLPGDTSQGAQLLTFTAFWKQEQEHQVDWFPTQSIEIDRLSKTKKHSKRFFDFRKSSICSGSSRSLAPALLASSRSSFCLSETATSIATSFTERKSRMFMALMFKIEKRHEPPPDFKSYSGAHNRYPIPVSVWMYFGFSGSSSSFCRSCRT